MTDQGPPPPAPPPGWQPPAQPGWPPPPGPRPYGDYAPTRRTNPLAIISLVFGCVQFVFCFFVGAVVAVITGHIARGQIKRNDEAGGGLATAGLILGYVGIGLTLLAAAGLLIFALGFAPGLAQRFVRDDARAFGRAIVREEAFEAHDPRSPAFLLRVYETRSNAVDGCCADDDIHLADGTRIDEATLLDWERVGWRIELSRTVFHTKYACLTVPATRNELPVVVDGRCA